MKRYVIWVAVETDDVVATPEIMESLLKSDGLDVLRKRRYIGDYGVKVRLVKEGETPPAMPPPGLLPKMGKA